MPRAKDVWLPLLVIHAALMASVILYGAIAYVVAGTPATTPPPARGTMLAVLGGVAGAIAVASFFVRAMLMPPRDRIGDGRTIDPAALSSEQARGPLARLRVALIVSWAMAEAVALCGLVLAFLFHDVGDYAPFGAGALALLFLHAPRPHLLVQVVNAVER